MKHLLKLLFSIAPFFFLACSDECPECDEEQDLVSFAIVGEDGKEDQLKSGIVPIDSVSIFYFDKGEDLRLNFSPVYDTESGLMTFQTGDLGYLNHRGIHNYTLYINGEPVTELSFLYRQKTDPERCCTKYVPEAVYADDEYIDAEANTKNGNFVVKIKR